ncbi:hypothetical protein EDD22DRAFT_976072 [Suillus occidentalis]|nr:hypothetical protein EDD22DRAFT_976072 [Suillus occidentalis]
MSPNTFSQIVLRERPVAGILPDTFESKAKTFDELHVGNNQALVQVTYLSLDPAMRGWINDARSYLPPVKIGEVMRSVGLGVVVRVGEGSKFQKGDMVYGMFGWTEYAVADDKSMEKITPPPGSTSIDFLNTLGIPGMTAYFGLNDVGQLKAGETLVVSGAAGAVGAVVCQLGKRAGARVIGIAGTSDKCAWLESDLGVEKVLNYKSPTFADDFAKAVGYLDVYFDNVGGDILDLALSRLNKNARVVLCDDPNPKGPASYLRLISQRAKMEGFIVYNAPSALPLLFSGANKGKLVVKVSDEPSMSPKL